jgi:hypothetical protein
MTSKEIVPTNVSFNGAEMCGIIIRSLPQDWQTQYQVSDGQKNQTKTHELLITLEAIEKVMDQKQKDKDSSKKDSPAKSGQNKKSSENCCSNGPSESFRIPKKQRTEKFCNRCKEHGGRHNTHNNSDCKRYKANGTPNKELGSNFLKSSDSKGGKGKPKKKWEGANSRSHISLRHLIRPRSR